MAKREYSNYQKKVISNYYEHLDTIMLTKLQEIVTDLYLADSKAKQDKLWERAQKAMEKLNIKPAVIAHILKQRDLTILAKNLQEWLKASSR
ncbi:MAG TPA: hypothetical protein P5279_10695 [Anaerohalosphaeraceae bacterium]|jgi:uncharacterized Fe-S radical SAM superfamily protein PflX|nr:hypothetical protein [Anaerohalosphaeraceae bacterium]HRT50954.1 hypothetical protein [Anaerohalosphaeraceae bacterium]HRT86585.1 hypothetical protein [Anaerohalosphaeraceae bacterium]